VPSQCGAIKKVCSALKTFFDCTALAQFGLRSINSDRGVGYPHINKSIVNIPSRKRYTAHKEQGSARGVYQNKQIIPLRPLLSWDLYLLRLNQQKFSQYEIEGFGDTSPLNKWHSARSHKREASFVSDDGAIADLGRRQEDR